jgi:putative ABC transport system permease protein
MLRDLRYAVRQLLRAPSFTYVAVLTLALGIGATSAIFSVVNGVLLRPLPYPEPGALVRVHELLPQYGRFSVAPANFLDWRQQAREFEGLAAYGSLSGTIPGLDGPERIQGVQVSWDVFRLLRVTPAHGPGFTADQDRPGHNNVIVLSHGLFQRRFNSDPAIVGTSITMNGTPMTVAGVMPPGFYFPSRTTEFWRPAGFDPANATRGGHFLGVIGRLKENTPGGLARASTEMKAIAERLAVQYPDSNARESAEVVPLLDQIVGPVRPALMTLLAAVGVVVLIACANVANLLLVRASVRDRELAIRVAMGASRRQIIRQMLVESSVLAAAGGTLGLLLAYFSIPSIRTLGATSIPRVADVTLDGTVLLVVLSVSMLTGVLFGMAPAWQASRAGLGAVLKEGGRSAVGAGGRWLRSGLLVGEVALSLVLLVGAALLLRSFANVTGVDPGFEPERSLVFQVGLPQTAYPDAPSRAAFFDRLLERFEAVPGVEAAGMTQSLPLRGSYVLSFSMRNKPAPPVGQEPSANHRSVSPGYFQTMGIPLKAGRTFTAQDTPASPMVAVIDEAFARRHFPDENPIGQGLDIGNGSTGFYEVVGVVGNVRHSGLDADATPTMYVPFKQDIFAQMWMVARSGSDPAMLTNGLRQALREIDPAIPMSSVATMSSILGESVAERRFSMLLLIVFAGIALFLAAVGLYGVVAYSVSQRTREIGLRLAIGAAPANVLRMVIGGGLKLALVGVAIGLGAAWASSGMIQSLLFDVEPVDLSSYAATAVALLAVAALAAYVPARRAMRVDPLVALQGD